VSLFLRLAERIDVTPINLELLRVRDLWDANTTRKTYGGSPHRAMSDIWVRFRDPAEIVGLDSHKSEYRNIFWPAWQCLPSLRPLISALKNRVDAVELGNILITRLPAGASILPHDDRGSWAAEYYNCKLHTTLAGTALVRCGAETVRMKEGEVWTFDNLIEHEIVNDGASDRVSLIVSMRTEI
jgi:hypothetical protein